MSTDGGVPASGDARLLRAGESVLLIDRKQRVYLRTLQAGGRLSVRGAPVPAETLIGAPEGSTLRTPRGETFLVLRPTYAELIPNLPRRAQPVYPKDVGIVLLWGDIAPGMRVVEIGVGPGALTLGLLRALGPTGTLVSYERREDFANAARDNVARFHGPAPNWTVRVADAADGLLERDVDRVVVDVPEPWTLLDAVGAALRPGGVLTCFLPTVLQVKQLVDGLGAHDRYACVRTLETLLRQWDVSGRSIRPQHRMVAHTGFLVFARRLAAGVHASQLTPYRPYSSGSSSDRTASRLEDDEGGDPREDLDEA
ncbi:MAG TPA: tRNA (adenine-N1)-methyltransferase [Candidatus Limnocylindria bacterium]|nr:tRNA (adenine-N1)-methyltransferase [Candidatus Limnocylindria bacterium]